MPKITIDNTEIEVEGGINVIQAASKIGIEIPHFCYHPSLSVVAQCRQCLVEVEGVPKVLPACNIMVRDGLVVRTNTEKAVKAREATLEFTLINHPLDCPICDKGGECPLQLITFDHGPGYSRVSGPEEKKVRQKYYLSDRILYDPNRCIMCTRCIRFTDEVTRTSELGTSGRGFRKKIVVFPGRELNNKLASNVIDICPVGALLDKDTLHEERVWYYKFTDSVCSLCSNGCSITVGADERKGKVSRIRPRPNPDVNDFWICDKGRYGFKKVQEDKRLRDPIVRNGSGYEITSWKTAIDVIYERLCEAGKFSHKNTAFIASPKLTNEELYLFRKIYEKADADHIVSGVGFASGAKEYGIISSDPYPNSCGVRHLGLPVNLRETVQKIIDKKIDVLFIAGEDLLGQVEEPNRSKLKEALDDMDFIAVMDYKLSDTAHFADVIIPGATPYEKDGTFINDEGRVQRIQKAISPPGNAKADWEALSLIGKRFDGLAFNYVHPKDIMSEIAACTPPYNGISYERIGVLGVKT